MSILTIPLVSARRKQFELEQIMGKLLIQEIIPLNLVRSQLYTYSLLHSLSENNNYIEQQKNSSRA